jgi:beta-glucosidase
MARTRVACAWGGRLLEGPVITGFMFATGVENSIPTIKGGKVRVDQMEVCGHYKHWRTDFELLDELGIRYLRYGPPLHTTLRGPGRYDWEWADLTFGDLLRRDVVPIVDLCHFGVPDWLGNFQNPDFPQVFEAYARAFAERFPWVQLYTPVMRCSSAPPSRPNTAGGTSS